MLPSFERNTPRESEPMLDPGNFHRLLKRSTLFLIAALAIPMVVLFALAGFLLHSHNAERRDVQIVGQLQTLQTRLARMQAALQEALSAGQQPLPQELRSGRDPQGGVMHSMRVLESLLQDPADVQHFQELKTSLAAWIGTWSADLAQLQNRPHPSAAVPVSMAADMRVPDSILVRLDDFLTSRQAQREHRQELVNGTVFSVLTVLGLATFGGIPLLTRLLSRLLRQMDSAYAGSLLSASQRARELEVTLNSIGDAVVATDAAGRVDFLNPVASQMMGYTQEEARGLPLAEVFQIFNEHTGEAAENPVDRVLRENQVVGLANHTVLRSRSGKLIPIEDSAAPIRDDSGTVKGVILVFHDVTEKHQAAAELRASESRLVFLNRLGEETRLLPDDTGVREHSVQLLGRFLRASRCAYATVEADTGAFTILSDYTDGCPSTVGDYQLSLFGPRAVRKMTTGHTLVVHHVDHELAPAEGGDMFRAIGIQAIICCPLLRNGRLCAMMAVHQTTPRQWTDAEVRLVETVVDRTWTLIERKRAETDLIAATERAELAALEVADAAERFRLLGEVVSLQVWTAQPDGKLDYVNQECLSYFGVEDPKEILGEGWAKFVHPEDVPGALANWENARATAGRYSVEFRLKNGVNGEYRWFLTRAEPMRNRQGEVAKWFGTNTAIHELKIAQSNAERASRAKDDFLAALSHELRTPLTPVLMTAVALRDDPRLPPEVRAQLGMMERNIALEARLIDDLLDVTSIARGKLQLRTEPCDTHSLIGLALEIVRGDAEAKGLLLECDFSAARSGLMTDPARFQQVIWNLLRNAVKFTPEKGQICIRTKDELNDAGEPTLRIEISDTGIGIAEASLEEIFLPFEQAAATGDHRFGGVGLGLSIARAIVSQHGGQIRAYSGGIQAGATFTVDFPGSMEPPGGISDPEPTEHPLSAPDPAPELHGKIRRLLLVEDHPATLEALQTLLRNSGYEVIAASTLAQAWAAAENHSFVLVISDLGLPDGTGTQLMEALRDRYQLKGIALSGYGMEEDIARCREAGFLAHLVKPVRFSELRQVLDNLS